MKHTVSISDRVASCSCRRWNGPQRRDGEALGAFTTRAFAAHLEHCEAALVPASQCGLFDSQADLFSEMFQDGPR
jgi:hypothetical protein